MGGDAPPLSCAHRGAGMSHCVSLTVPLPHMLFLSGLIAVARLTQRLSPNSCTSPACRAYELPPSNTDCHFEPSLIGIMPQRCGEGYRAPIGRSVTCFTADHVAVHESGFGRYCCKSRKLQIYEFFVKTRNGKQSPNRITSIALPKS